MKSEVISLAQSAERILVPVSADASSGINEFTEQTGIEIPNNLSVEEFVISGKRTFRLVRGADMPGQLSAGWGDIALCSTEAYLDSGIQGIRGAIYGRALCRFSVLALKEFEGDKNFASKWREQLTRSSRYPMLTWRLPTQFPRYLNSLAAADDLPITSMWVPITGKAEATMHASGVGAVADRVVTGRTAAKLGAEVVSDLADIYPELLWRQKDADIQ